MHFARVRHYERHETVLSNLGAACVVRFGPELYQGDEVLRPSSTSFSGVYKNSFGMVYSTVDHMPQL